MRYEAVLGLVGLSLLGGGCIASTTVAHQRATVRSLQVVGLGQAETESVVFLIDPITTSNWQEQPDITSHVMFEINDLASQPLEISTGPGGGLAAGQRTLESTTARKVREDTFPLVPLPTFRVQVLNRSKQPVVLRPSEWSITDGNGAYAKAMSDDDLRLEVERQVAQRHRNLYDAAQRDMLAQLREQLLALPLFGNEHTLAPGEEYQGFVSFNLYTDKPIRTLDVTFDGTCVGETPDAPIKFAFATAPKPTRRCPVEGEVASVLGVCKSDIEGYDPAPNGPCIQQTRTYNNHLRTQLWIASSPVADSDLYRTLQSQSASRKLVNHGLSLRAMGWAFVGAGLLSSMIAVLAIAEKGEPKYAPAGLAGLSISTVGFAFAYKGQTTINEGMTRYNEVSETSGVCAPVW